MCLHEYRVKYLWHLGSLNKENLEKKKKDNFEADMFCVSSGDRFDITRKKMEEQAKPMLKRVV